ncbi:MAG TPA: hypothetical protein VG867_05735 [Rhizomicrobium sp.]|nr:hypothetical protein [Rhizomicrobium sp.]
MTRNTIASAAVAALLGAGAFAASTSPAAAYDTQRCDAYGCWTDHCEWDSGCHRIPGSYYERHRYYSPSGYYRSNGYYDGNRWVPYRRDNYHRRWVCDVDGDDCHYVYESF